MTAVWIVRAGNRIVGVYESPAAAHLDSIGRELKKATVERYAVQANPLHSDEDGLGRYHTDDETLEMVMGPKPRLTRPSPPGSARVRSILGNWTVGHVDEDGRFISDEDYVGDDTTGQGPVS